MKEQGTFGNSDLAKKIASKFGTTQETVNAEMRYTKVVQTFIRKVDEAHRKAAESTLKFG
jgi:pyrroline-5-carboxylate reductase